MSDHDHEPSPSASEPAGEVGRSGLWLPALAAMLLFLIAAAVMMLTGALGTWGTQEAAPTAADNQTPAIQSSTP